MSIRASNWAWGQALPPSQKVLLLALADQADDDGVCWPSMKTLARKICADVRTAQRNMRELQDANLVSVEARRRPDGDATSNLYRLALTSSPPGNMSPPNAPRQNAATPVTSGSARVVTSVPPQEPSYISISEAAAPSARELVVDAAANGVQQKVRQSKVTRPSGIVCWNEDDLAAAPGIETTYLSEEIAAGVVAAKQKMTKVGKPQSPTPGVVENEILLARAAREEAARARAREAERPLTKLLRKRADRERREADPVARKAADDAARRSAAAVEGLGF